MRKKFILPLILILTVFLLVSCKNGGDRDKTPLSPGLEVLADKYTFVKCGIKGNTLCFDKESFDLQTGKALSSIMIASLPDKEDGVLTLNGAVLSVGDVIGRKDFDKLVFEPAGKETGHAVFSFTSDDFSFNGEMASEIFMLTSVDLPPVICESAATKGKLTVMKNISAFSILAAEDPEKDGIVFEVTAKPKHGTVEFVDASTGEFCYTPATDYTGSDRFSFRARDVYGNYSEEKECELKVVKVKNDAFFTDMVKDPAHSAAIKLVEKKIMKSSLRDGKSVFLPDREVTRAEFLSYAAKLKNGYSSSSPGFSDDGEIQRSLYPYVAYAVECGWESGAFSNGKKYIKPNESITVGEAAVILNNAFGLSSYVPTSSFISGNNDVAFAQNAVDALESKGYTAGSVSASDILTKRECALLLSAFLD